MATNDLSKLVPKILAQGLMTLRQNAVTPRLVANMTSSIAGKKGSTIDVPIPSAVTAVAVAPAAYAPVSGNLTPDTVPVVLDQWYEAPFELTDREYEQVMDGVIPMQAEEAVKSIVNVVDAHLLSKYKKFYGYYGTAGTTPFGTPGVKDATNIRGILNKQLAPLNPRHMLLDPDADTAALALPEFARMDFSGSVDAMREGMLNRKLGMQWWMNQNMPLHTTTVTAGAITINGAHATLGVKTLSIAKATNAMNAVEGDVFTIAGDTQTYVVTAAVTLAVGNTNVTIEPGLKVALAGTEVVTFKATRRINLAMHRDAIAFANRPLVPAPDGLGGISLAQMDPISGLTLRLEVVRQHKQTRWSFDFLWGAEAVRRELGAVLAG